MQIHRENLIIALSEYVNWREDKEELRGYTADSALLVNMKELLSAVEKGEDIKFFPE